MTDNERESYRQGFIDGYRLGYEEGKKNFHETVPTPSLRCEKCGRACMSLTNYVCGIIDCPNQNIRYLSVDNTVQQSLLNFEDNMNKGTTT